MTLKRLFGILAVILGTILPPTAHALTTMPVSVCPDRVPTLSFG